MDEMNDVYTEKWLKEESIKTQKIIQEELQKQKHKQKAILEGLEHKIEDLDEQFASGQIKEKDYMAQKKKYQQVIFKIKKMLNR